MFGHHSAADLHDRLTELLAITHRIERRITLMSGTQDSFDIEIASLTQTVSDTEGAEASAEAALNGIPALIEAAIQQDRQQTGSAVQLTALSSLVAKLRAGAPKLAAAVAASQPPHPGTDTTGGAAAGDTTGGAASGTDTTAGAAGATTVSGGADTTAGAAGSSPLPAQGA